MAETLPTPTCAGCHQPRGTWHASGCDAIRSEFAVTTGDCTYPSLAAREADERADAARCAR